MEDAIAKLVEFVELASPMLWATARQQVSVRIVQNAFWLVVCSGVIGMCIGTIVYVIKTERYIETEDFLIGFSLCVGAVALFFVLIATDVLIGLVMNPDYYATKALLGLIQ